jgi:CheY-like chemotaxis protein
MSDVTADPLTAGLVTLDGRRPRVAIVGGTPAGAMVATVLCHQFGCTPFSTPSGESVLALLRRNIDLDLVVMDLAVPDMDGIVAVELIRTLGARGKLPVIALADDRSATANPRGRAAAFAGTVVKPYSPREVFCALQSALGRGQTRASATAPSRSARPSIARAPR